MELKVTFQPQGRTVYVLPGTKIIEAAAMAGVIIDTPCGGAGTCKKCKIAIIEPSGDRVDCLACQRTIDKNTTIEVPQNSLMLGPGKIVVDSEIVHKIIPDRKCENGECFGVAVDLGTTTLAASLVNLKDGAEIAVMGSHNPQISNGDDVISRIKFSIENSEGLANLQKAVIRQINSMIDHLCKKAGIKRQDVLEISVAGNTAMQHLFRGIEPSPLAQLPFEPNWRGGESVKASELDIHINPQGVIYIFPVIGGFVGGDISAGMLAVDLLNQPQPLLMIDIGTNGEIVLVKDNKIFAASTAAGPAFEGAGISCGMRAMNGAIEKVKFENNKFVCNVIGDTKPVGICGSGLIDMMAEFLNAGVVDCTGRMNSEEIELAPKVKITQRDIRQIQLAVGAIRAGISIMLKKADIKPSDLKHVLVAGGFGSFIRRNHAQRIGLLPDDISHEKILFIGNTSLAGAKLALLSLDVRKKTQDLADRAEHIELSADFDFQNEFANAMIFP
jgi:uncharacterized 2Fe-2S/4Fe-4S cluster protein (DUF4445 family)